MRETAGLRAEHADVRERLQTQIAQLTQQLSEALLSSEPSRTLLAGAPEHLRFSMLSKPQNTSLLGFSSTKVQILTTATAQILTPHIR